MPTDAQRTRRTAWASPALWLCLWGAACLSPAPVLAQASRLDQSALIDRLADEGMGELLERLVRTDPPRDPVVAAQVEIASYQLRYRAATLPADRAGALDATLASLRQAIAAHSAHPQRPVWQTDLAELIFTELLPAVHQHAAEFYEFGIPAPGQVEAFETGVPEALVALADADARFAHLQAVLPREPDYAARFIRSGLEQRLFEDYWKKRTRFYLALAAHLTALLPDTHAYYASPSLWPVPGRVTTASEEKARLRKVAIALMEPWTSDPLDPTGLRAPALAVVGRIYLAQGKPADARTAFDAVLESGAGNLFELLAHLGEAQAQAMEGQFAAAADGLSALSRHPLAASNPLIRLLIADAMHRAGMAQMESAPPEHRQAALAAAYQPYLDLLEDPALNEHAEGMRQFIYMRWSQGLDVNDPAALPPIVRVAIAEVARAEGQNLVLEAGESGDDELLGGARDRLAHAISLLSDLQAEPSEPLRARVLFNLALARYFSNPQELGTVLEAVRLFVTLADTLPAQREAREGLAYALTLLHQLLALEPRPEGVGDAYDAAAGVLFNKFGSDQLADDERVYYGSAFLMRAGRFDEAASVLAGIPRNHPDYYEAQREMLLALEEALAGRSRAEQDDAREGLARQAQRVRAEARGAQGEAALQAAGAAELVLAGTALREAAAHPNDPEPIRRALQWLDGFEQRYDGFDDLVRVALERRIMALAAGAELDQLSQAARSMMDAYPDAAAHVVDRVLVNLDREVDDLRSRAARERDLSAQRELHARAQARAATASSLADMLVQWAAQRGYGDEDMMPYRLVLARSKLLAGQPEESLAITRELARDFGRSAQVLHQHAEALFAVGGNETLIEAAGLYDRLIEGLRGPPYPDLWWNAWMRRLQVADRLNQGTADVPLRVRQLRLTDPNLGGPPYRETMERLAEKHAR